MSALQKDHADAIYKTFWPGCGGLSLVYEENAAWRAFVTGPGVPFPTGLRLSAMMGVTSRVVPVTIISDAK